MGQLQELRGRPGQQALCSGSPKCHDTPLSHHGRGVRWEWGPDEASFCGSHPLSVSGSYFDSPASWDLSVVWILFLSLDALTTGLSQEEVL